jgi:CBS domain-containing protein
MADALRRFVGEDKSGVAVVDDRGRVVANLSLADLRVLPPRPPVPTRRSRPSPVCRVVSQRLTPENAAELLRLNVGAFLSATQELPKDPVTCRPSATLTDALHLLHSHRVHRVPTLLAPPPRSPRISDRGRTRAPRVCVRVRVCVGVVQVYVTDEQGLPVGVFSTTDAVANLCP